MSERLRRLLDIDLPIMQAGMGVPDGLLTTPALVSEVTNAGGMGCIGGTGLDPEALRDVIRTTRGLTDGPFGVDLLLPANLRVRSGQREVIRQEIRRDHPAHWRMLEELQARHQLAPVRSAREFSVTEELTREQVRVVLEESVPLLVVALGDPGAIIEDARAAGTLVAGIAGSGRNAQRQLEAGVDIIIAQGSEAGGHTGNIGTMVLVPEVVQLARQWDVPVVAAGGIASGAAVVAALALGAEAAWCGTAFLFSDEVNLHAVQHEQLRAANPSQLERSRVYTGKPSRMFRNEVVETWVASGLEPLPMPHQRIMMDDFAASARQAGRFDLVSNPAGQIAGLLDGETIPARRIVETMVDEMRETLGRLAGGTAMFGSGPSTATQDGPNGAR